MDLSLILGQHLLEHVSIQDGYIQADYPAALTLTRADMARVYVTQATDGRHSTLVVDLAGGLKLHLVYPVPPDCECHRCRTLAYRDTLEYVSADLVEQYPALAEHRCYMVCRACMEMLADESGDTYTGPDGLVYTRLTGAPVE